MRRPFFPSGLGFSGALVAVALVGCAGSTPAPPVPPQPGVAVEHVTAAQESGGSTARDASGKDRRDDGRHASTESARKPEYGSSRPTSGPPTRGGSPPTHK